MPVSEALYRRVVLASADDIWELECGHLRAKPEMTTEHDDGARTLVLLLGFQLDLSVYTVGGNSPRLRTLDGRYYVPDVCVIPRALIRRLRQRPRTFEVFDEPMPLVVEFWSPSTGRYDVGRKLAGYRERGDAEVWLIHPYERWLRAWRRQPDGSYSETRYDGDAVVEPASLAGVRVELARVLP
jgi:Uma2 family endonuclease